MYLSFFQVEPSPPPVYPLLNPIFGKCLVPVVKPPSLAVWDGCYPLWIPVRDISGLRSYHPFRWYIYKKISNWCSYNIFIFLIRFPYDTALVQYVCTSSAVAMYRYVHRILCYMFLNYALFYYRVSSISQSSLCPRRRNIFPHIRNASDLIWSNFMPFISSLWAWYILNVNICSLYVYGDVFAPIPFSFNTLINFTWIFLPIQVSITVCP